MEIGSNDLCVAAVNVDRFSRGMYELCLKVRREYGIGKVVMFEILERERSNKYMEVSLQEFNDRVRLVNHLLEGMCVGDDKIRIACDLCIVDYIWRVISVACLLACLNISDNSPCGSEVGHQIS
jgi:hypothetical protein